jgi:chorismate mutase
MKRQLATVILLTISENGVRAQNAIDKLQPLVETSARRLAIAQKVALTKWDSKAAVEDAPREAHVLTAAAEYGVPKGLSRAFLAKFFTAQIEANKFVQYSLLADWHRAGRAPAHGPINLASIRGELDRLQIDLVDELADTLPVRATSTCRADTAKAVGKYAAAHQHQEGDSFLLAIALDRALATICTAE